MSRSIASLALVALLAGCTGSTEGGYDSGSAEDIVAADALEVEDIVFSDETAYPDLIDVGCPAMIVISTGTFKMGCDSDLDELCVDEWGLPLADARPAHIVNVPSYRIDRCEVTNIEYLNFINGRGVNDCYGHHCFLVSETDFVKWSSDEWDLLDGKEHHPIVGVTWYGAQFYCEWLGNRLCSEAEWEKAARGSDYRTYPWGNDEPTCEYAVIDDNGNGCGTFGTMSVGSKPEGASPYGILDMSGNAMEWVLDCYHHDYQGAPDDVSAWTSDCDEPLIRIARGGYYQSWFPSEVTVFARYLHNALYTGYGLGFRCCAAP